MQYDWKNQVKSGNLVLCVSLSLFVTLISRNYHLTWFCCHHNHLHVNVRFQVILCQPVHLSPPLPVFWSVASEDKWQGLLTAWMPLDVFPVTYTTGTFFYDELLVSVCWISVNSLTCASLIATCQILSNLHCHSLMWAVYFPTSLYSTLSFTFHSFPFLTRFIYFLTFPFLPFLPE